MPIRGYLTPWQEDVDADGGVTFYPRIGLPGNYADQMQWRAIDLRTAEQKNQVPAQGWTLVLINVTPPQHNQIMNIADTHEVNLSTTPAEVIAIIGDEATEHLYDPATIDDIKSWFMQVKLKRIDRYMGRI